MQAKSILHPTDFSPVSQSAFQFACTLAKARDYQLIVLHVQNIGDTIMGEFGMVQPAPTETAQARHRLDTVEPPPPMRIERLLNRGDPAQQILAVARSTPCDLIVMGTRGHSALHDPLLGSVAAEVVRHAPCPVLTLTPQRGGSV
ncbi:MAG TPA: universal stress protein [Gemmataceae bacterium]|nr:universal stress protein [Gemmataceae bacterium]